MNRKIGPALTAAALLGCLAAGPQLLLFAFEGWRDLSIYGWELIDSKIDSPLALAVMPLGFCFSLLHRRNKIE